MKRRVLSVLLALAILATMVVVPVVAAENITAASTTPVDGVCPCGCGQVLDAITWKPWNVNADGDPADGQGFGRHQFGDQGALPKRCQEIPNHHKPRGARHPPRHRGRVGQRRRGYAEFLLWIYYPKFKRQAHKLRVYCPCCRQNATRKRVKGKKRIPPKTKR